MTHSTSTRPKRAALALACAGVLAGSLGISAGAHATGTSTARQPVVRMDDLLHPVDVAGAFAVAGTTTSRVGAGNGDFGLSGCTGETRTSDVVGSGAHLFHEVVTGAVGGGGSRFTVQQHVADQRSSARAATTYRALLRAVRECQHEPAGHWRYGATHRLTTGAGTATWMSTIDGDGSRVGGVLVARSGRHLAVVEALGAGTSGHVQRLAADTLSRLR